MKNLIILLFFVSFAAQGQTRVNQTDSIGWHFGTGYTKENSVILHLGPHNDHKTPYVRVDDFEIDYFYPQFGTWDGRNNDRHHAILLLDENVPGTNQKWIDWFVANRSIFPVIPGDWRNVPNKKIRIGNINLLMEIKSINVADRKIFVVWSWARGADRNLSFDTPIRIERFGTALPFPIEN